MKTKIFTAFYLSVTLLVFVLILHHGAGLGLYAILKILALGAVFVGGSIFLYIQTSKTDDDSD